MKKTRRGTFALCILAVFFLQACATGPIPAVERVMTYPPIGKSADAVSRDKMECDAWAKHESGIVSPSAEGVKEAVKGGVIGALAGAAVGAAIGAVIGAPGKGAAAGAAGGAAVGGVSQGMSAANAAQARYEKAYALCMNARGYSVSR